MCNALPLPHLAWADGSAELRNHARSTGDVKMETNCIFPVQVAALVQIQDDCSSWPGTILPRQQQIPSDAPEAPDPTFLQTLQAFCRAAGLSGFKVPRVILGQTDPLPINASGKLVKADVSRLIRSAQLRWQYSEGPRSRL